MSELSVVSHTSLTISSRGATVVKEHKYDWLLVGLIILIQVAVYFLPPFAHFVSANSLRELDYPLTGSTVPIWAVLLVVLLLPIIVFVFIYIRKRDVYDLHHSVLGLFFVVFTTGVLTEVVKATVGQPRPDFLWRCFPNGLADFNDLGNVMCNGAADIVNEGYKSFPSVHTSWSFSGLGFLSLYIAGKAKSFDRQGHVLKLIMVFLPLVLATLIGISRVDDYWNRWEDVYGGAFLGLFVAAVYFFSFFRRYHHPVGEYSAIVLQTMETMENGGVPVAPASLLAPEAPTLVGFLLAALPYFAEYLRRQLGGLYTPQHTSEIIHIEEVV